MVKGRQYSMHTLHNRYNVACSNIQKLGGPGDDATNLKHKCLVYEAW